MSVMNLESMDIYFAFPDGVLDYDCPSCDALCCRYGNAISGSSDREIGQLIQKYPGLGAAALARRGDIFTIMQTISGCVFLQEDRLCGVEVEHGPELKPSVCQLFPFNIFKRFGDTLVVHPHALCPLVMSPGRAVKGNYASLTAQLSRVGLSNEHITPSPLGASDGKLFVDEERAFLTVCSDSAGRETFLQLLIAHSVDKADFSSFISRAMALMGFDGSLEPVLPCEDFDALWCAVAPTARLSFFDVSAESRLRALGLGYL
ncbi:MAG: hypothetical protein VX938_05195, partial [Myxococcota bacterium]|nr:hypothetical protein [Myxococcota bacterium]